MSLIKARKLTISVSAALVLAACGGGDGARVSKSDGIFTVDGGIAQKGPMAAGSKVSIDELISSTFASAGTSYNLQTTGDLGSFDTSALRLSRQYIKTYVSGYYRNELTGQLADDQVTLMAYSDLDSDRLVNVNLLTTLAGPRIEKLVRDTTSKSTYRNFRAARDQAEKEVLAAFRIYNSADLMPGGLDSTKNIIAGNFNELDLSKAQAGSAVLAALSAVAVKAGINGAGISEFIADFQADIAVDGLVSQSAVRNQIDTASATTDMALVATNLKKFFPTTVVTAEQLSTWIDSSGGADQVIDRYKSTASAAPGTETQSTPYSVGMDDIGQCVSASVGKLYKGNAGTPATANLVTSGIVKAVATDFFKIGLSGDLGQTTGYIQRFAPLANGNCPTAVPTSGVTRVAMHSRDIYTGNTHVGFIVEGGVAQKGPLAAGSRVSIDELVPSTFASTGTSYDLQTRGDFGEFDTSALKFKLQYIKTYVSGYYRSELTGELANDQITLMAYSDLDSDRLVNVNLLTTLAGPRIEKLVQDKTNTATYGKFAAARTQAQKEVLAAFRIYNAAALLPGGKDSAKNIVAGNFNELDMSKAQASGQMLAALSAVAVRAGGNGAGISEFIADFQADLAADGLINQTAVRTQIDTASATKDIMVTVAASLKKFFPSTTITASLLSPWIDSSGGVDQLINKYKFSTNNVAVGTLSKSPAYTVGTDDIGQCFSVGGVTTAATAGLYYNGASTAVVGTQIVKAGDSVTIGINASSAGSYSGFIQRSAPVAGVCPTTAPTSGLVRVQKYTVTGGVPKYDPQGRWTGTTPSGSSASIAILENGETWSVEIENSVITGAYYGQTIVDDNQVTMQLKPIGSLSVLNITGTVAPKSSLTLSQSGGTSATFAYDSSYDTNITAAGVKGSWSVGAVSASSKIGRLPLQTLNINEVGQFTYNEKNCAITVSMSPRLTGKSIYNMAVTFSGIGCQAGDVPLSGIAYVNTTTAPNKFLGTVLNSSKTDGLIIGGIKQ